MRKPLTKLARPSGALAMVAVDQREAGIVVVDGRRRELTGLPVKEVPDLFDGSADGRR